LQATTEAGDLFDRYFGDDVLHDDTGFDGTRRDDETIDGGGGSYILSDEDPLVARNGEKNWRAAEYEIRVATMDSTGYVRWLDLLKEKDQTSVKMPVLRFEPIPHPTVLLAEAYRDHDPVRSLRNLAVRDGAGSDRCYIAPPRTSLNTCELHGVLDPLEFDAFADFADIELDESGQFWVLPRGSKTPVSAQKAESDLKKRQKDRRAGRLAAVNDPDPTFEPIYRRGSLGINRRATTAYYPDPMARRVRFLLTDVTSDEGEGAPDEIVNLPDSLIDLYPHDAD
jgi:hypothetical protein